MLDDPTAALAVALAVGVAAQLFAERLRIPAIILLLTAGLAVGPALGLLEPDELYGELLFPAVSAAVAILLFDGGLSLRWRQLGAERFVVLRLLSLGVLLSWLVGATAAWLVGGLPVGVAVLFGAIMVVTGPTVVIPLLRQARLRPRLGRVLRWEGIFVDPVGAVLAVVVLEVLLLEDGGAIDAARSLGGATAVGIGVGLLGAAVVIVALGRHLVPDHLENGFTLMAVLASYAGASAVYHESGLFATTVMGVALANQRRTPVRHIAAFHESLGVLLVPLVFVLLGARVSASDITDNLLPALGVLVVLVVLARPLSVWTSTIGSGLSGRERTYIASLAPRGIVAASVSALFGLRLERAGVAGGADLAALTFLVVAGTVVLYGLAALPLARRLRVDVPEPGGVVLVGSPPWAAALAAVIVDAGVPVLVVATDEHEIDAANEQGMLVYPGRLQGEELIEALEAVGARIALVASGREELAAFAADRLVGVLGRANVFVVPPDDAEREARGVEHGQEWGRVAFAGRLTGQEASDRLLGGQRFRTLRWTEDQTVPDGAEPLLFLSTGAIPAMVDDAGPPKRAGTLVVLADPALYPQRWGRAAGRRPWARIGARRARAPS